MYFILELLSFPYLYGPFFSIFDYHKNNMALRSIVYTITYKDIKLPAILLIKKGIKKCVTNMPLKKTMLIETIQEVHKKV